MNYYPYLNTDYIGATGSHQLTASTLNITSSNIKIGDNDYLSNIIYTSNSRVSGNDTITIFFNNNHNYGEIFFKTKLKYPIDDNIISGVKINEIGKLLVYHNYNILQPTILNGFLDVEDEIAKLIADGITADLQLTTLEATVVLLQTEINTASTNLNNVEARLNTVVDSVFFGNSYENFKFLLERSGYTILKTTFEQSILELSTTANSIYYNSVLYGLAFDFALGYAGGAIASIISYNELKESSNVLYNNTTITNTEKNDIYDNTLQRRNLEKYNLSNFNYSINNMNIINGFYNSNNAPFIINNTYNNRCFLNTDIGLNYVGIGTNLPQSQLHLQKGEIFIGDYSKIGSVYGVNNAYKITFDNNINSLRGIGNACNKIKLLDYSYYTGFNLNQALHGIGVEFPFQTYFTSSNGFNFYNKSKSTDLGYNVFCINSNFNVGIGNSIPNYKLDVNGDINFTGSIYQNGVIFSGGGGTGVGSGGNYWNLNGTNIYNNNSGFVGIGISTPNSKLQLHTNNTTNATYLQITDNNSTSSLNRGFNIIKSPNNDCFIYNSEGANLILGTNNIERIRITSSGSVGIGLNPSYLLDINGDFRGQYLYLSKTTANGAYNGLSITNNNNNGGGCEIQFNNSSATGVKNSRIKYESLGATPYIPTNSLTFTNINGDFVFKSTADDIMYPLLQMDAVNNKVSFFKNPYMTNTPFSCSADAEFFNTVYINNGAFSVGGNFSSPPSITGLEITNGLNYKFGTYGTIYLSQVSFIYNCGSSYTNGVNTYNISYPNTYTDATKLIIHINLDTGTDTGYIFSYSTDNITTTNFNLNIFQIAPVNGDYWTLTTLNAYISIFELF